MGSKNRPRPGGSWAQVIDLQSYRKRRGAGKRPNVLLVQGKGQWISHLKGLTDLMIHPVSDPLRLRAVLQTRNTAVALVDGNLDWIDTVAMVQELHQKYGIPTILVADASPEPKRLKELFQVGLHDVLVAPHGREEIGECLELLCKIGQVAEG